MRLKLPIDYTITAALRANSLGKRYAVVETVEVNIQEIESEDFPMAVSWQQKSLPWEEPVGRQHTCFVEGDHWRPIGPISSEQVRFGDDAHANLNALNTLLPKSLNRSSRVLTAVADDKHNITISGESVTIIDADRIVNVELDSIDLSAQFEARFGLHRKAGDLLICGDTLYHRVGEPVLVATLTTEHRPPNTISLAVNDTMQSYDLEPRERILPLYTHKIDRLDDFRSVFGEKKPAGNHEVYDLIDNIEVYRPDLLRFEDDLECIDSLLFDVRRGLSTLPNNMSIHDAVEMHRLLSRRLDHDEKVDLLIEMADHPTLFKGTVYSDLKSKIDLVNDRWRFRPMTKIYSM
jgi:hypothetical protein